MRLAPKRCNPPERAMLQCLGIPYIDTNACVDDPIGFGDLLVVETAEVIVHGAQTDPGHWLPLLKCPPVQEACVVADKDDYVVKRARPARWSVARR